MPRGGKRAGAGRKPTKLSVTGNRLKKATAEEILASVDEMEMWQSLLNATQIQSIRVIGDGESDREMETVPDWKIRLESLKYLTDRRDGKPAQSVYVNGESDTDLDTGSLPTPQEFESRNSDKPN